MLVAPSAAGALLSASALALFLSRTAILKWWTTRSGPAHRQAARSTRIWGFAWALAAPLLLLSAILVAGQARLLLPLLLVAPLAAVQLRAQLRREARGAGAELSGALALSALTPALVLATGWSLGAAALLWTAPALRAVLSVYYVRAKLRLERGDDSAVGNVLDAHACGSVVMLGLATAGWLPGLVAAAFVMMTLRAMWGLLRGRARATARQVGLAEMSLGIVFVVMTAAGYWGVL
jgi:hypothetical protein